MPRVSDRKKQLQELDKLVNDRAYASYLRLLEDDSDSDEEDLDYLAAVLYQAASQRRYFHRPQQYRSSPIGYDFFQNDLQVNYELSWLNNVEFQRTTLQIIPAESMPTR